MLTELHHWSVLGAEAGTSLDKKGIIFPVASGIGRSRVSSGHISNTFLQEPQELGI